MNKVNYIIVQAGGVGSRMGYVCINKPKAMVSINGEPMILRLMKQNMHSKFLIIGDYKAEVLRAYLKQYAPAEFEFIHAKGTGTCAGISECLEYIPSSQNFAVVWCDLFFDKSLAEYCIASNSNFIGLSQSFPCRWGFFDGILEEKQSSKQGVAGVYFFKNKDELSKLPTSGEFCAFLKGNKIEFLPIILGKNVQEIGTLQVYQEIIKSYPTARPFNDISYSGDWVIKKARDQQGVELGEKEKNWYSTVLKKEWSFIPAVKSLNPLTLERIYGGCLYNNLLNGNEKKEILKQIVEGLKKIHTSIPEVRDDFYANDYEAILGKTKKRLDSIKELIPFANQPHITINRRICKNPFFYWSEIEEHVERYFTQKYVLIHGDLTFSNILYDPYIKKVYFIDPRGYYGKLNLIGDEDYDWAKLYYSIVGNYDQFNSKNYRLEIH